jgi:type II secretory pathway component PulK
VVIASVAALASQLIARTGIVSAQNRIDLYRAAWHAESCLAQARTAIDASLEGYTFAGREPDPWLSIDSVVANVPLIDSQACTVVAIPSGLRVDVNEIEGEQLRELLLQHGVAGPGADSLVDALLDWRDSDDVARPLGAESGWYDTEGIKPRNGRLADIRELSSVRGFHEISGLDSVLGVETGRVSLQHASARVLACLPGFTPEVIELVLVRRTHGARIGSLDQLLMALSPAARDSLSNHLSELNRLTTTSPDFWTLNALGASSDSRISTISETRFVRAPNRAAIVQQKSTR